VIDRGVSFKWQEGTASVDDGKVKIFSEIDQKTVLDEQIHAVVSRAALALMFKEIHKGWHQYLEAVCKGGLLRLLRVDLRDSKEVFQATVNALVDALGGSDEVSKCEELKLYIH